MIDQETIDRVRLNETSDEYWTLMEEELSHPSIAHKKHVHRLRMGRFIATGILEEPYIYITDRSRLDKYEIRPEEELGVRDSSWDLNYLNKID